MKMRAAFLIIVVLLGSTTAWLGWRAGKQNARIRGLELELLNARAHPGPAALVSPSPAASLPPSPRTGHTAPPLPVPSANPTLEELNACLTSANARISGLDAKVSDLESQVEQITADRDRAGVQAAEAQARRSEADRDLETARKERGALDLRLEALEAENGRLRQQQHQGAAQKSGDIARLVTELQSVSRRQQTYLNNILRRYREITELLRSFPGTGVMKGSEPELSRIQSAVSMADEDLKQLGDLNARLGRVQKGIATAAATP